ncbi:MAG TPA: DUF2846 domain-containing protein [Burkholderiales bacterium]|nr:DUF2846 domain-containing protein [Burkholderiales bacterium]
MFRKAFLGVCLISAFLAAGCASVPMASKDEDTAVKAFSTPPAGKAGLYIYRNTFGGQALKKKLYVDGVFLGETANKVYFYKELAPGQHEISTESEFSNNALALKVQAGNNYFVEQFIKIGVFVGGAALKQVSEEEGKKKVLECMLAKPQ